jgi:hypothetical protein
MINGLKITDEMLQAFKGAWDEEDLRNTGVPGARRRAGIAAVLEIVARDAMVRSEVEPFGVVPTRTLTNGDA